jgi:AcrR family transcriptional regulator
MSRRPSSAAAKPGTRDRERSQERILDAALAEFAAYGFAGARVDVIARRAGINKRMLYHYFGNKEGLFRAVLRRKMAQRRAWGLATPDPPAEGLPYWFELAYRDVDWVRLLEWEALQFAGKRLVDEEPRREAMKAAVERLRRRQELGHVTTEFEPQQLLLAMTALTWFPIAFPQLTRLMMGHAPSEEKFQKEQRQFLQRFAAAFEPRPTRGQKTKWYERLEK